MPPIAIAVGLGLDFPETTAGAPTPGTDALLLTDVAFPKRGRSRYATTAVADPLISLLVELILPLIGMRDTVDLTATDASTTLTHTPLLPGCLTRCRGKMYVGGVDASIAAP